MEYISTNNLVNAIAVVEHPANSFVELDFSLAQGESWDAKDQPNNMVTNCFNGSIITGFETSNIVIQTEGRSFFSEAIIYFSDSQRGSNGIEFAVGASNNESGISSFTTNSILDITDLGIPDVESLSDNEFHMQFYESTDDNPAAIDARYTSGKLKIWGVDLQATTDCPFIEAAALDADISVTMSSDKTGSLAIGDSLAFEINSNNASNNTALSVVIHNTISTNLNFIDSTCDTGFSTTDASAVQSIVIGDVLAQSNFSCVINTEVMSLGQIINTVTVDLDNDGDPSNNSITLVLMPPAMSVPATKLPVLIVLFWLLVVSAFYSVKRSS